MLYSTKCLAPAFICYNIILYLSILVSGQITPPPPNRIQISEQTTPPPPSNSFQVSAHATPPPPNHILSTQTVPPPPLDRNSILNTHTTPPPPSNCIKDSAQATPPPSIYIYSKQTTPPPPNHILITPPPPPNHILNTQKTPPPPNSIQLRRQLTTPPPPNNILSRQTTPPPNRIFSKQITPPPPNPNILTHIPGFLPPSFLRFFPPPPSQGLAQPIPRLPSVPEICPKNKVTMKIVCANVIGIPVLPLMSGSFSPLSSPCCRYIQGLLDIEVAACFCSAITFDTSDPKTSIPVSLVSLLNYCHKELTHDFRCVTGSNIS